MWTKLNVKLYERVVLFEDSVPVKALGPGRHLIWRGLFHNRKRHTEQRFDTRELDLDALPEVRACIPSEWFEEYELGLRQRGVLYRDGVPTAYLRPGVHRFWTVDQSVELRVFDVDEAMPELSDELAALIPAKEYGETLILEHQRGLEYRQGRLSRVLGPGRYTYWKHPEAQIEIARVDMRRQQVTVSGQELMTRDKVTLRLTLTAEFLVEDPALVVQVAGDVRDSIYLLIQLAARDYVASVTLDELLGSRHEMTEYLEAASVDKAKAFGVRVERLGVKDVVLPGEMKALLNRVIEAEKEAAANVILRREETAATRSLANTARVMADHPVLLRLKELDAMKEIAERIHEVRLVVGSDGLDALLPAQLLGGRDKN